MKRESMKLTLDFPEGLEGGGGGAKQKTLKGEVFLKNLYFLVFFKILFRGY